MRYLALFFINLFLFFSCADDVVLDCENQTAYQDLDGDGLGNDAVSITGCDVPDGYVLVGGDCNDNDETLGAEQTFYQDADEDGSGNPDVSQTACAQPDGYVLNNTDCNDEDADVSSGTFYYQDLDEDGLGNPTVDSLSCAGVPDGYVLNANDCDDSDAAIGETITWYEDVDGDGFGDANSTQEICAQPDGYVANDSDCDDSDENIGEAQTWYEDADGDGLGNPDVSVEACDQPDGYVNNNDDDDDNGNTQNQLLSDFEMYFFDEIWRLNVESMGADFLLGSDETVFEIVTLNFADPAVRSGSVEHLIDPDDMNQVLLISPAFGDETPFQDTIVITSVTENAIEIMLTQSNGTETSETMVLRDTGNEYTNCVDRDRLFEAEWLVPQDAYSLEYFLQDSIRFVNTLDMLGEPLNSYGIIGYPTMPNGDSSGFFDLTNDCNIAYNATPVNIHNSTEPGFEDVHLFTGSSTLTIDGDILRVSDSACNGCGDLEFLIID